MTQTTLAKEVALSRWTSLREKMHGKLSSMGLSPITDEEARRQLAVRSARCDLTCPECHGDGFIRIDPHAEITDSNFGKYIECTRRRVKQLQNMDTREFGIEKDEISLDWDAVKYKIGETHLQGMKAVKAVRPKFEQGHGMVALLGKFGQGKTLVGKILIARALACGKRAAYANMSRILNDIRAAFDEKDGMTRELLRKMDWWNSLDVLFIDELDKANETDWARSIMFEVLDRRYVRAIRQEALTVVASNRTDSQLDGYLVDRLKDNRLGPIVRLDGPSARPLMPEGYRS